MTRTWTREDAACRLLAVFVGKQPGASLHISVISPKFVDGDGIEELLQALTFASAMKWLSFDGENVTLLPDGFSQSHEFPARAPDIANEDKS